MTPVVVLHAGCGGTFRREQCRTWHDTDHIDVAALECCVCGLRVELRCRRCARQAAEVTQ